MVFFAKKRTKSYFVVVLVTKSILNTKSYKLHQNLHCVMVVDVVDVVVVVVVGGDDMRFLIQSTNLVTRVLMPGTFLTAHICPWLMTP